MALGLSLAAAAPAMADGAPSAIAFTTASPVQTAFGGNWIVTAYARYADIDYPLPGSTATVSVFVAGQPDALATGLPIQPDGEVYISQPASKAPLAAGQYQLTAVIVPVAGGNVSGSQTATPLTLTVSAYAIAADVSVDQHAAKPVIVAKLAGDYVDTTKSVPAGTWTFTLTSGGKQVLSEDVAQAAGGTDALRVPIDKKLDAGATYRLSAKFAAVDAIAPGLNLTQPKPIEFSTQAAGLGSSVPFPLWALIVVATVFALLIATAITLQVNLQKRRAPVSVPVSVPESADAGQGAGGATALETVAAPIAATPVVHDPGPWVPETPPAAAPALVQEPGEFTQLLMGPVSPAEPVTQVLPPAQPVEPKPEVEPDPDEPGSWSLLK
jgi:hypothetical protein